MKIPNDMYHYEGCGLPYVYLQNGFDHVDTPYGRGVTVHDIPGLHRAIGDTIVASPTPMVGCEFRFLRQELDLSQAGLAALIGCDAQSVARWEKGKSRRVDPASERILRVLYREAIRGGPKLKLVRELLRKLEVTSAKPSTARKIVARERNEVWRAEERKVA